MAKNVALVAGSNGVTGCLLINYLEMLPEWKYHVVSKRKSLLEYNYNDLVDWSFVGFSFNCEYDVR